MTDRIAEIREWWQHAYEWGSLGKAEATAIDDLLAEIDRLRAQVAHYEHMIGWETSCSNCASVLDSAYAETARREEAEATIARVEALMEAQGPAGYVMNYALRGALGSAAPVGGVVEAPETPEPNQTPRAWEIRQGDGPWIEVESQETAKRIAGYYHDTQIRDLFKHSAMREGHDGGSPCICVLRTALDVSAGVAVPEPTETPKTSPEDLCPSCGSMPDDDSIHRPDCERNGTCAQFGPPWIEKPWHAEPDPWSWQAHDEHMREAHSQVRLAVQRKDEGEQK